MDRDTLSGVFDPDADSAIVDDTTASEPEVTADEPEGDGERLDVQGTMRWSEFNRRNEEIKRERTAIEAERRDFQARAAGYADYEEFTRTVQANPALAQDIRAAFDRHQPQMRRASAMPPEIEKEVKSLKSEVQEARIELLANRIEAEAESLRREQKISTADMRAVIQYALEEGVLDTNTPRDKIGKRLQMAYRDMNFGKAKGAGERELATKLRDGQRAAAPGGRPRGSESDDAEPTYDASMSYEQIAAAEMKRLGVKR